MADTIRASAARIDVTPQSPAPLAGYIGRSKPYAAIHDGLEMNALRIDAGGKTLVLLTIDSLSFSKELEDYCRARVPQGIDAHVFGIASHTHFAPALDPHLDTLGEIDGAYRAHVFRQAEKLMADLFAQDTQPARIAYGASMANHSINRRRRAWRPSLRKFPFLHKVMCLLPNPAGLRDETLRLLKVETLDGTPLAALWSYKCHPVALPYMDRVSADYPGVVRDALREKLKPELPCLFLPGFAGNVRPNAVARVGTPKAFLRYLLQGPFFGIFTPARYGEWSKSLAAVATRALDHARAIAVPPALTVQDTIIPYSMVQQGEAPEGRPTPEIARVSFGNHLSFLIVSGEPVLELREVLGDVAPSLLRLCIGYRGHVFGYWPTSQIVVEGGYEADGFRPAFGLTGQYYPNIDTLVRQALANDAARN